MENISTVEISTEEYKKLIKDSEQLRILKNFAKDEKIFIADLLKVIEATEGKANE